MVHPPGPIYLDKPPCGDVSNVQTNGFADTSYNDLFLAGEYYDSASGEFLPRITVNNRPVFLNGKGKCMWWHEYRHWWMGTCDNIGLNQGYAYC
jgi:hypothetical protein